MSTNPTDAETEQKKLHKFWTKQPIVASSQDEIREGYIDEQIPVSEPPSQATLPKGFQWANIDILDDAKLTELHDFLAVNYIEDDNHRYRFHLSKEVLFWALSVPGMIPDWIFCVRSSTGAICGFISGTPAQIRLNDSIEPWCTVNFLCVHPRLRGKNLPQLLIFELARRVRVSHVYRAVFSGSDIPSKPFFSTMYEHRPINVKKLSDCDFYPVIDKRKHAALKKFGIPNCVHNVRPMLPSDVDDVCSLLQTFTQQFKFAHQFTPELVRHMFLPRDGVVYSYVIPHETGAQAFFSFYMMNWTILQEFESKTTLTEIHAAYLYYFATKGIKLDTLFTDMVNKAAVDAHADVINALSEMGAGGALTANHFERGSKELQFYSYNYAVPTISDSEACFFFV